MSQTSVQNFPDQAREGFLVDASPVRDIISRIAETQIPFGKLVVATTGQSEDLAKVPTAALDITTPGLVHGVAFADTSKETIDGLGFGAWSIDDAVGVVRKGRIWVIAEDEITDLDKAVFVRFADPGVSPPDAALGSFRTDADTADAAALAGARWRSRTVGTFQLAILELDL